MGKEKNLTPWPKGVSGNPKGLPKGTIQLKTLFRMVMDHEISGMDKESGQVLKKKGIEWVIKKHLMKALSGDMAAIKEIYDRYDGKVAQTNINEGNPDAPLQTMVVVRNESDQEIVERFKRQAVEEELRKNGSGVRSNPQD